MNVSDWSYRFIDRAVYDFGTSERAAQALEELFSPGLPLKQEFAKFNSDQAAQVAVGEEAEVLTPEEFRALGRERGTFRSTQTTQSRLSFNVDTNAYSKAVHYLEDSLIQEVETEIIGDRKEGGAVVYNTRLLTSTFPYQQESACFLQRGRYILFAVVGVRGNRRTRPMDPTTKQGPFVIIPDKSIFPGRMWQHVLAVMREQRFDDPGPKWDLPEERALALCMSVAYMRRRAKDVQHSNPGLSQLLVTYADRIQRARIGYQDKAPSFNKSGEAAYWDGSIVLYGNNMETYEPFKFANIQGQSPSDAQLGYVASVLMHEAGHASGTDEWQAHKLQQMTFEVLRVGANNQLDNKKYFKRFPMRDKVKHPVDYILSQYYWLAMD